MRYQVLCVAQSHLVWANSGTVRRRLSLPARCSSRAGYYTRIRWKRAL
jgi:hypothetical protein